MSGRNPEHRVRRPIVRQAWRHVSFLHWRILPDLLDRHLPDWLSPDVIDGSAWIGLTPFRVERARSLGLPAPPPSGSFPETNLRTYVRHDDGRDGLWFFSLDVSSMLNVAGGRLIAVPYFHSAMSVDTDGPIRYQLRRRVGTPARHDITIEPGPPIEPDDVLNSLTGRWRAFTIVARRTVAVAVEHEPWPLHRAQLVSIDETLISAAGLPTREDEPMVHFSPGVNARLGPA